MGTEAEQTLSYEDVRRRKLEENKKKLEELNLSHLSLTLRDASPKPSPAKQVKRKVIPTEGALVVVRRSVRFANRPGPVYKEVAYDVVKMPRRIVKRRCLLGRVYASDEARSYAQERAEEVESELEPMFPSFVKPMLQSHVTGGFWLGLSKQFCNSYLPKRDTPMTLIDENGDDFETLYLAYKRGLSAGWRGFSIFHELVDGDALVFQLVKPTTFKVYIIRASGFAVSDGATIF